MLLVLRTQGQGRSGFLNIGEDFGTDDSREEAPRTNNGFKEERVLISENWLANENTILMCEIS
jgi:hypothetical protein